MRICPKCGKVIGRDSCVTHKKATPQPGDYSLCDQCFTIFQYSESLSLIVCTDPPAEVIAYSQALRRVRSICNFN